MNRSQRRRARYAGTVNGSLTDLGPGAVDQVAALVRPGCSECGSPVWWRTATEAAADGVDVAGAVGGLGGAGVPLDALRVWECRRDAGHHGVLLVDVGW